MALLHVSTDNPKFSYLISKHPDTKLNALNQGKGHMFGWYSNKFSRFNVWFRDGDDEVTYLNTEEADGDSWFEYLNLSRFNSSIFPIQAIDNFLSSALKDNQYDGEFNNELVINMVYLPKTNYVDIFNDYFKKYSVELVETISLNNYKLKFSNKGTLKDLLSYVKIFCLFNLTMNNEYYYKNEKLLGKYIDLINQIDAPYFLRYLFKFRFLYSKKHFNNFKEKLEQTSRHESIKLSYGDSHVARIEDILGRFSFDKNVFVDVGCGEGRYLFKIKKKHPELRYVGIDVDKEQLDILQKKCTKRGINFVEFGETIDRSDPNLFGGEVLLTEVIEHMDESSAFALINDVLKILKPERFIITTPNKVFNQYFIDVEEFRHDDHKFEWTYKEFCDKISGIINGYSEYSCNFYGIGDCVDGNYLTSAVEITKS